MASRAPVNQGGVRTEAELQAGLIEQARVLAEARAGAVSASRVTMDLVEAAASVMGSGRARTGARGVKVGPGATRWLATLRDDPALLGATRGAAVDRIARVYESLLGGVTAGARKRRGVHYTPAWLIEHLLNQTLEPAMDEAVGAAGESPAARARALLSLRVLDPACGTGLFLLAAARRIAARLEREAGVAWPPAIREATRNCVCGVDVDQHAVAIARALLRLQAGGTPNGRDGSKDSLFAADALRLGPERVRDRLRTAGAASGAGRGFDVIVGNPPFLNQLARSTGRSVRSAAVMAEWSGGAVRRYADAAGAFLLLSAMAVREGGRVGLVQPRSILTAGDARPIRTALACSCTLDSLWVSDGAAFEARVHTCALTLTKREAGESAVVLRRFTGAVVPRPDLRMNMRELAKMASWGGLAASDDSPRPRITTRAVLGDIAVATADFRDAYYGLRGCVQDGPADGSDPRVAPIITTGLIDLACAHWGKRTTRLHGQVYGAPGARLDVLGRDAAMARWSAARLVPKVLLATQTRVLEAVVDEVGAWLPCTPVITVTARSDGPLAREPATDRLWMIAAALASPVCCALARHEFAGSALNPDAIKLSAKQAMCLPLPVDDAAWRNGAACLRPTAEASSTATEEDAVRLGHLADFANHMNDAHGLPHDERDALTAWWLARLIPRRKGPRAPTPRSPARGPAPIMTASRA